MDKILINLGLAIIPFFLWFGPGIDTREPKLILALVLSLTLSLYVLFTEGFKPYKNIWLILLIGYIPLSFALSPTMVFDMLGVKSGCLWYWKAYMYLVVFFMAHIAISNIKLEKKDVDTFLNVICWTGLIMTVYCLCQKLGFEQFFWNTTGNMYTPLMTGTLGNRNILAAYLVMVIPIALYLRAYYKAGLISLVIILTNSQVMIGALLVSLMFLIGCKSKKLAITMASLFVICALVLGIGYFKTEKIKKFVNDNERFNVWKQVVKDIKNPILGKRYCYTGFGIGSFRYLYHNQHLETKEGMFYEAHNDYLEFFYNTGLIGITLLLSGIWLFIKQCFPLNRLKAHLFTSFICVAICAGGMYVWQLGATIFYTIVITGLLKNETILCNEV